MNNLESTELNDAFVQVFTFSAKWVLVETVGSFITRLNRKVNRVIKNRIMIFRVYGIVRAGDETF